MINTEELNKFLNIKIKDLEKLDMEKLRLMLGVFRYMTRVLEREINARESGTIGG